MGGHCCRKLLIGLAVWTFFEDQDADSLSDQSLLMGAFGGQY